MDYNTIQEIINNFELPVMTFNENGEPVIISKGRNNEIILETEQNNNTTKINTYYPEGIMTEIIE